MPQVIEVTTYSLEELEPMAGRVYARALEQVRQQANAGGDYCSWISEYLQWRLEEEEIGTYTRGDWDYDRGYLYFSGDVDVRAFMAQKKLRGHYRAFWHLLKPGGVFDWTFHVDSEKSTDFGADFVDKYADDLYRYSDLAEEEPARYALILRQLAGVGDALQEYLAELGSALLTQMRAEIDWRYSDDFAQQEAEQLELRFLANGDIFAA